MAKSLVFVFLTRGVFINDMVDTCGGTVKVYLFADDAKMYCHIKDVEDLSLIHI